MKKKIYFITTLIILSVIPVFSQQSEKPEFNGAFCIQYNEDETRNYFAVNLNELNNEALQKAFMKKMYYESHTVAINSPDATGVWLLTSHKAFKKEDVIAKIEQIRSDVIQTSEPLAIENSEPK